MMLIFTQTLSIFYRRKWLGSFVIRFFLQHHQTWRMVFEIMTIAQSFTPMSFSFECIIQCILQHDTYIYTNMSPDVMMIYFLAFYILNIVNTFIPKSIRSFIWRHEYYFSHHAISQLITYQYMSAMLKYPHTDLVVTFVITRTNILDAT